MYSCSNKKDMFIEQGASYSQKIGQKLDEAASKDFDESASSGCPNRKFSAVICVHISAPPRLISHGVLNSVDLN